MADVNFSYPYSRFPLAKGGEIHRPMLPVQVSNAGRNVDLLMLLDSGADYSMIPREIAEQVLGLDVAALPVQQTNGVGNTFQTGSATLSLTLSQHGHVETFSAPVQIPLNCPNFPAIPLIGREPLFRLFEIHFRQEYTDALGKFVLRKVTKRRDPSGFAASIPFGKSGPLAESKRLHGGRRR